MTGKKELTDENYDRVEWLMKVYAEWKDKQWPDDILEIEEYIIDEPYDLNLEKQW